MAEVIYALDKNTLSISKHLYFCKQEIYKNDFIIDIHVNTEVLTTGLVITLTTKGPLEVASTQWCK